MTRSIKKLLCLCAGAMALCAACGCAAPAAPLPLPTIPPVTAQSPSPAPPAPTPTATPEPTPVPLQMRSQELIDQPLTRLINDTHLLDKDYVPDTLISVSETNGLAGSLLTLKRDDLMADETALNALYGMLKAASADGMGGFYLVDAYRTYAKQQRLWANKVDNDPAYGTDPDVPIVTARPGASEHQAGLAFDIAAVDARSLSASFANTPQGEWLYENCWEYGFILRYPEGSEAKTGIVFEPWHFRYVGIEMSMYLYETGMTLEEFYCG